jgi:hypothetical protein
MNANGRTTDDDSKVNLRMHGVRLGSSSSTMHVETKEAGSVVIS